MQRQNNDIIDFSRILEEKLIMGIQNDPGIDYRNYLSELILERQAYYKNNDTLNFLSCLNVVCLKLLNNDPRVWIEDDKFAKAYKSIFFNRSKMEMEEIGPLYPFEGNLKNSFINFNISKKGIQIFRSYPHYTNIVYEGGGVKGIAYAGVHRALMDLKLLPHITRVAGSSAGAITAAMVAIGYGDKQLSEEIKNLDFKKLQDIPTPGGFVGSIFGTEIGIAREALLGAAKTNLQAHNEAFINSGRVLLNKLRELIAAGFERILNRATPEQKVLIEKFGISEAIAKNRITFFDLENLSIICPEENIKTLVITGAEKITDDRTRLILFSAVHSPRVEIAQALRISASIPLFFRSVKFNNRYCIDGAVEENLPFRVFDRPEFRDERIVDSAIAQTVAFKFVLPGDEDKIYFPHKESKVKSAESFVIGKLAKTMAYSRNRQSKLMRSNLSPMIVPISNENISATSFNLSVDEKKRLEEKGYRNTKDIFDSYNIPDRGHLDNRNFANLQDAINVLTLDEVKGLIEHINFYKDLSFIYMSNLQADYHFDLREVKKQLENRQAALQQAEFKPEYLDAETKLQKRLSEMERRHRKLSELLKNDGRDGFFPRLHQYLNKKPEFIMELNRLDILSGSELADFIVNAHLKVPSHNRNNVATMNAISMMQDRACKFIAKECGFRDAQEVKNEIFYIEELKLKQNLSKILVHGFNSNVLSTPLMIDVIKSTGAYQELQSWTKRHSSHYLSNRLNLLFSAINEGKLEWFNFLVACNKKLIVEQGQKFSEKQFPIGVPILRLYYNAKEGKDEVNLRPILDELIESVLNYIRENLLKTPKDKEVFSKMLQDLPSNVSLRSEIKNTFRK